jgi:hypothetical protein
MNKYTIRIDENEFYSAANKEIVKVVGQSISFAIRKTRTLFVQEIKTALRQDIVYLELLNYIDGILYYDVGLSNAGQVAEQIVELVVSSIELRKLPARSNDLGGIGLTVLKDGIQQILSLPMGSYQSKGGKVDWLDWLLTAGTSEVISGYRVMYGFFDTSRTGQAIMVKSKTKGFSIDPDYAGTENDNWITRSLKRVEGNISNLFQKVITDYINI